jgi:hypothetical protein
VSGSQNATSAINFSKQALKTAVADQLSRDYAATALQFLKGEHRGSDTDETDNSIRRALRRKDLGAYDQDAIDRLRTFTRELARELHRRKASDYYQGPHGEYVDLRDFDVDRMAADWAERYPEIPRDLVARFVPFAVYNYYLR